MKALHIALIALGGAIASAGALALSKPEPARNGLVTAPVTLGVLQKQLSFEGAVEFGQIWDLISPATGRLLKSNASLGSQVQRGAVLMELAPGAAQGDGQAAQYWLGRVYPAQKASLAAESSALRDRNRKGYAAAAAKLRAMKELRATGAAADEDVVAAERELAGVLILQRNEFASLEARRTELEQRRFEARTRVAGAAQGGAETDSILRAPFAGVVTALSLTPGATMVQAGQHVATLVDDQTQVVRVTVGQNQTFDLVSSPQAKCVLPRRNIARPCILENIQKIGDTYQARYRLSRPVDGARGEPGQVIATIERPHQGLIVPKSALRYGSGRLGVTVVRAGRPVFVAVSVLFSGDVQAVVRGNLSPGERVAISG